MVILTLNVKYKTCVLLVSQITSEYQKAATKEHFDMKKLNRSNIKVWKIPDLLFTFWDDWPCRSAVIARLFGGFYCVAKIGLCQIKTSPLIEIASDFKEFLRIRGNFFTFKTWPCFYELVVHFHFSHEVHLRRFLFSFVKYERIVQIFSRTDADWFFWFRIGHTVLLWLASTLLVFLNVFFCLESEMRMYCMCV